MKQEAHLLLLGVLLFLSLHAAFEADANAGQGQNKHDEFISCHKSPPFAFLNAPESSDVKRSAIKNTKGHWRQQPPNFTTASSSKKLP